MDYCVYISVSSCNEGIRTQWKKIYPVLDELGARSCFCVSTNTWRANTRVLRTKGLAPVVETVDSIIHWISCYLVDEICKKNSI